MDPRSASIVAPASSGRVIAAGTAWLAVYVAARWAVALGDLADVARLAAAFMPLFAFYWFVAVVRRELRNADELQRQVQLEALALAFPTSMVVLMTLGLMEIFHGGRLDLPLKDAWVALPAIYGVCLAAVRYRYR